MYMKNGGYIMVDFPLDMSKTSSQTLGGVYDRINTAYGVGKPIVLTGLFYGSTPIAPVNVVVYPSGSTYIVSFASTVLSVANDDSVTNASS